MNVNIGRKLKNVWVTRVNNFSKRKSSSNNNTSSHPDHNSKPPSLKLALLGMFAGGLGPLVGMGGSFVALPFLQSKLFRLTAHNAVGTSMAVVLATSIGGICAYILQQDADYSSTPIWQMVVDKVSKGEKIGNVDLLTAIALAASSSLTVIFGAKLSKRLPARTLRLCNGGFLLCMAPLVPLREYVRNNLSSKGEAASPAEKAIRAAMIGAGTGVVAGLFGVGGGALTVPALCLLTDLDYHTALGTSLAAMVPTAISGCYTHFRQGTMLWRFSVPLALGSFSGAFVSGLVAKRIDAKDLKNGFAVMMVVLGLNTLHMTLRVAPK